MKVSYYLRAECPGSARSAAQIMGKSFWPLRKIEVMRLNEIRTYNGTRASFTSAKDGPENPNVECYFMSLPSSGHGGGYRCVWQDGSNAQIEVVDSLHF